MRLAGRDLSEDENAPIGARGPSGSDGTISLRSHLHAEMEGGSQRSSLGYEGIEREQRFLYGGDDG